MLTYKQDPSLPNEVVTLLNGEKEYRLLCKRLNGVYYRMDDQCFEVEGKWYPADSGVIVKDWEKNIWIKSNDVHIGMSNGIVSFNKGLPVMGYFTINPYNNVTASTRFGSVKALNQDILVENNYIEDISTGIWIDKKELTPASIRALNVIQNKLDFSNKGYNIEDNTKEFVSKTVHYNNFTTLLSKDVRRYARMLGETTWGLEIECSHGFIPEHIQNRLGVVICRDGSLKDENGRYGPEFTTIPLSGAKGLQTSVNLANELKKRTLIDTNCSLHIHLGNLPTSRLFLVSMYVLGIKLQDEIFKMFPYYKTDWKAANKEKDYCQKLKKQNMGLLKPSCSKLEYDRYINNNYSKLFYFYTQNDAGSGYNHGKECNRKQKAHPIAQKWNRKNRYYWLNLMNCIFSSRNTVEFRLHTPTVNSQKIVNWLFICNAIVRYAVLHSKEIITSSKKIELAQVLDYYKNTFRIPQGNLLSEYLKAYVSERTAQFQADFKKNDFLSEKEMNDDKKYEFKFGNITHLF